MKFFTVSMVDAEGKVMAKEDAGVMSVGEVVQIMVDRSGHLASTHHQILIDWSETEDEEVEDPDADKVQEV